MVRSLLPVIFQAILHSLLVCLGVSLYLARARQNLKLAVEVRLVL